MATAAAELAREEHHVETEQRVTPLELFFDLVFVFAITQVTSMVADDPSAVGLARGMLVLTAVWWAWAAYAWLTNNVDTERGEVRLTVFASMAAMLVVALAVPEAFDDHALAFGVAYLLVRVAHIGLYAQASEDVGTIGAVKRLAPTATIAPGMILAASGFDGVVQGAIWATALVLDYLGPIIARPSGWQVAPGHFAERHGLIIIIALGESIVALGIGATGIALDAEVIAAAVLGIVIVAALWWSYFDVVATVAERRLRAAQGAARAALARDSYSYLHLPMVAGIVLLALGVKKALGDVDEPLKAIPAIGLCGGVALYFLAHLAFRLRNVGTLSRQRLATAIAAAALIPVALEVEALVSVALVAALCSALIAYEAIRFREARARVRAH